MLNVDVNLGKACNNRCLFCSNGRPTAAERRWARVDDVETEIRLRRDEGADAIGFLGGEPTLYPHLERIIGLARELGYGRIALCSNGTRLADEDRLNRLLDAGLSRVALSIHSHQARVEDGITGRRGSFAEKRQAIVNLAAAQRAGRLPDGLSLNTVLHGKNLDHLEGFVQAMRALGVADIRFNSIRPTHQAEGSRTWVPAFVRVTPKVMQLVASNEAEPGMRLTFADIPLCKLPWGILANPVLRRRYVGENWDLITDVSEMRRQEDRDPEPRASVRFNWKDKRMEFKTHLPGCSRCALARLCEGVWQAYLDIHGPDEFAAGPAVVEACVLAGPDRK